MVRRLKPLVDRNEMNKRKAQVGRERLLPSARAVYADLVEGSNRKPGHAKLRAALKAEFELVSDRDARWLIKMLKSPG